MREFVLSRLEVPCVFEITVEAIPSLAVRDDGARTRDLCRDSIVPLLCPRPLP